MCFVFLPKFKPIGYCNILWVLQAFMFLLTSAQIKETVLQSSQDLPASAYCIKQHRHRPVAAVKQVQNSAIVRDGLGLG